MNIEITANGDLPEICEAIEERFKLDALTLLDYCKQAPYADTVGDSIWPIGSIFPNEYRLIYGLIRTLKPKHVVEAGTYCGCSATAILTALDRNQLGKLVSFDRMEDAGNRIPNAYRSRWQFQHKDAVLGLSGYAPFVPIDFFFEDTQHTRELTRDIFRATLPHMAKGGLMLAHDPISRPPVLEGLRDVGIEPEIYLLEGSNCGVTLWQNP